MKQREPRQKVMLAARLRHDEGWSDASILNVSSRGLLLHGTIRPARGTYLEIRRGPYVVVGRVVWVQANKFGVRTQDRIVIDSLIAIAPVARQPANDPVGPIPERRARPRSEGLEWRYAKNQNRGRAGEFAAILALAFLFAGIAFQAAGTVLSSSLAMVSRHLETAG